MILDAFKSSGDLTLDLRGGLDFEIVPSGHTHVLLWVVSSRRHMRLIPDCNTYIGLL